ncbi:SDR family oxidoreductase [Pseudoalteromonas luteoviolacea]|uniref:Short-chain dehydrogenase n=1 Tax=Pseudoalteromonas luteoviolacea (strain 2ta16) TaxID=1353533 RepID=V4HWN6_PSEL2|nr:SDR family oxidoreductase [Pseudoalteromonas luteoviolacea]ESP94223.1 short-chain dehydrogenase [Pseudoalteromonas luteoviolacea 2ta16]KZN32855.1 short-chain dehydrogenase [Pseudoalteromonas luteoviolacea NCIMB 1944]
MSKSILITGCSTGIGLYCAKTLHKSGYKVIASVRNPKHLAQFTELNIPCVLLDLSDEGSIQKGFEQALQLCDGQLDVLFNNGAYGQLGAVEDLPTNVLRQQFEVNFFGWHTLTRLAVSHMRTIGQGRIVQNSSVLGLVALPYRGAYNASKFALEGLTDTLRMELADTDIQISLIEPGPILSEFRKNARQAFEAHIDITASHHSAEYQAQLTRLKAQTAPQKFTLGPEAVYDKLLHAIEAPKAKPRYYVTFPTYLMGYLKRVLSSSWLDKLLLKNR